VNDLKNVLSVSLIMLGLFSSLFLTQHPIHANAESDTWHVPTDFPSIQAAINNATPGDVIRVDNGTYFENLVVNKTVSLIGNGPNLTTVDGNEIGSVFNITSDNVVVEGFSIRKSATDPFSSAINLDNSSECRISNNKIFDSYDGITLHSSTGNAISNNTITSNFYTGISLYFSSGNVVSGNVVSGNYDGVNFYSSSDNVISKNSISDSYTGMSLYSSSDNLITGNVVSLSSYYGLIIAIYSNNNTIYHNNFNNTNEIFVSDSANAWNFSGEGNYWARSIMHDSNADGIGDISYDIDGNNIDYYPLMGAFTGLSIFAR
jgi:parallel beta-helix repeat protein